MSLRDEIQRDRPSKKMDRILNGEERVASGFDPFTEDEREELLAILEDPTIESSVICRLLKNHGYSVGENTVLRYRKEVLNVSK